MKAAKDAISQNKACIKAAVQCERKRFVGHIGRFGQKDNVPHLCKAIMLWRPLIWWKYQQWYNDVQWDPITHNVFVGGIRSYERHLPPDWLAQANA